MRARAFFGGLLAIAAIARASSASDHLEAARYFDQLGVRAYAEGRFVEAKSYFRASLDAGGPATELWNLAKCDLQIGDARAAVQGLVLYLDRDDISSDDRREAEKLLADVQKRPSSVAIASEPGGATVRLDDHVMGTTPLTLSVAPGEHHLHVERAGVGTEERTIVAEYGIPITIASDLGEPSGGSASGDRPPPPPPTKRLKRFGIEVSPLGVSVGLRGNADPNAFLAGSLGVTYTIVAGRRALFGAGLRFAFAVERWGTSAGVPNAANGCTLPPDYGGVELFGHPFLFGALRLAPALSLGVRAGFGIVGLASPSALGGDYFEPSCSTSTGLRGDFFGAVDVSIQLSPIRIFIEPFTLDLHGAYDGTRAAPYDTTGVWTRIGGTIGAAIDL